jgi:hypothetical protein
MAGIGQGLSPPLEKGDLGGFELLIKIPPAPPLGKGGKKICPADVVLIMKQTTSLRPHQKIFSLRATQGTMARMKSGDQERRRW